MSDLCYLRKPEWRPFANDKEKIITEVSDDHERSSKFVRFHHGGEWPRKNFELFIQVQVR